MPLNVPGLLAPFQLLFRPYLVIPSLVVKDVRCLDFPALHRAGYRGAVFDKDNCLTVPYEDTLVPELKDAWEECRSVFGSENILIVSNSAGTHLDPGGIQAESVLHHLGVPVLRHDTMKPGYACIGAIRAYFASLPQPVPDSALFIVGDRIFTDVVLANRMRKLKQEMRSNKSMLVDAFEKAKTIEQNQGRAQVGNELEGPLAVFVEGVWKKEATTIRYLEKKLVDLVRRWKSVEEGDNQRLFVRS